MFSLTDRIITISTGDESSRFHIHEKLLRERSHFFDAALSKSWNEGQQGHVSLPEDSQETVRLYLLHLYSGKLHIEWSKTSEGLPDNNLLTEYVVLAHLYVFGEKIGDISFKNAIVRAVVKRAQTGIGKDNYSPIGEAVDVIYKGTPPNSKMRKLLVDNTVARGEVKWIDPSVDGNNAEFLVDLSRAFLKSRIPLSSASFADLKEWRYEEVVAESAASK